LIWDGDEDLKAERLPANHLTTQPKAFLKEMETVLPATEPDPTQTRGHFSVMNQFLSALNGGPPPETRSSDNIHSLAMVLAAIESAEQGRWVEVRGM
jgi:predicted dehydrogenase